VVLIGNSELIRGFVFPVAVITRPETTVENIDIFNRRTQQHPNFNIYDDHGDNYGGRNNITAL
jgi:hypothetical protein